ncbi:hypothetical protein AAFC00_004677 [Neodothiora populina]|uniref:Fe2OG dioxygenase domain-containing protein n=1 Tax=Neodothiora populina TaxID=2781224 RepID=A0ABR3P350_9PEZI
MASDGIKPRTILEYVAILGVLYFFLGGQFSGVLQGQSSEEYDEPFPVSQEKIESLVYPDANLKCHHPNFDVHIFSSSPLIIYIESFLSEEEKDRLMKISEDKWTPSTIFNNGVELSDESVRKSEKAMIERDHVVQCIEQRALSFQGWPEDTFVERLWTQRYNESGHYANHYDWAHASKQARRVSTFMVYVKADCVGGGTNFPLLNRPKDERWCQFIDCEQPVEEGVTFLAKAGNAVFWENFDPDGNGWREGLHSGMPVKSGVKVGLNVWSWYQRGHGATLKTREG